MLHRADLGWESHREQIEGLATCAAASIAYLVLPDFPTTTKWLTEDERRIAHARLQMDALDQPGSDAPSVGHMENLKAAFTDWRTYVSTRTIGCREGEC